MDKKISNMVSWNSSQLLKDTLVLIVFFMLFALINGYPIFFHDTESYLHAITSFKSDKYRAVLSMILAYPFFKIASFWGWLTAQVLVTSYVLSGFKNTFFKKFPMVIYLLALYSSLYAIIAITLIPDFYTTLGLICIFAILSGKNEYWYPIILTISTIAHYGNAFVFFFVALIYGIVFKSLKKVRFITILIVVSVLINSLFISININKICFLSPVGHVGSAFRLMYEMPKTIKEYALYKPDSYIGKNEEKIYTYVIKAGNVSSISWGVSSPLKAHLKLSNELKDYLFFTIKSHPFDIIKSIFTNTIKQFTALNGYILYPYNVKSRLGVASHLEPHIKKFDNKNYFNFLNSRFINGNVGFIQPRQIYKSLFYLCLIINIIGLITYRKKKEDIFFRICLFSIIVIIVTSLIMPNLSSVSSRYIARASTLSFISAFFLVYKIVSGYIKN